ncbi:hypothetical protein QN239_06030 [Mycolicibacterium sp. Y3]
MASVASQISGTPVSQLPPPPGSPATAQLVEGLDRPVWFDAPSQTATEYWPGSAEIRQISDPRGVTTFLGGSGSPVTAFRDTTSGTTTLNLGSAGTIARALAQPDGSWTGTLNGNPVTVVMSQAVDGRLSGFSVTGPAQVTDTLAKDMQFQNTLVTTSLYNAAGNWTRDIETTTTEIPGVSGMLPFSQSTDTVTDPILRAGTGIESWFRQNLSVVPNVPYDWHVLSTDGYNLSTQMGAVADTALFAADLVPAARAATSTLTELANVLRAAQAGADIASTTAELERLAARASQIHSVLDQIAQNRRTTAVLGTQEGFDILASGGRDLTGGQKALKDATDVLAALSRAHAEVTALHQAGVEGLTPDLMAVTRKICDNCVTAITEAGGTVLPDGLTASWRP